MTIKEIAEAAGISSESVRRKARDLFPDKFTNGKKTVLNQKQAIDVMKQLRKINFVSLEQSIGATQCEKLPTQNEAVSNLTQKDLEMISSLTAGIVSKIMQNLDIRMSNVEDKIAERKALLPPPGIKPRDNINKLVRAYVDNTGESYSKVFGELYTEFKYRYKIDARTCAKNRRMAIIDYIESEGMIEDLESVAIEVLK